MHRSMLKQVMFCCTNYLRSKHHLPQIIMLQHKSMQQQVSLFPLYIFLTVGGSLLQNLDGFGISIKRKISWIANNFHYSTVESDLLNSLAWDIFYILSSTVEYKMSTMGYKLYTLSTVGYKLLYPIVDKKYPTLSY